jgi:hypothetical protein
MLHLRALDLLYLFSVAGYAELFGRCFPKDNLSIFGRLVTKGTGSLPRFKRRMRERQYEFRPGRFVCIVAGKATGFNEGLPLMSLDQLGIMRIMAIHAQSGAILLQLEIEFPFSSLARLMDGVADLATHIQSGVAAAVLFDADTHLMTRQAEIRILPGA